MYGNSLNREVKNSQLSSEQIASITRNENDSESTSSSMGKSVEEKKNENTINSANIAEQANTTIQNKATTTNTNTNTQTTSTTTKVENQTKSVNTQNKKEEKKTLSFQKPVEGEVIREFATENLTFSETLQEWVTHNGIDIKADKTSVVQAAEDGTVKSIKNDPRFGLTIVIEHEDGFQTVYANLLSSEFVTEGEKVIKGQSIGTVGNTAVFESADEPHLHFEIIKDSVQVDPNLYLK